MQLVCRGGYMKCSVRNCRRLLRSAALTAPHNTNTNTRHFGHFNTDNAAAAATESSAPDALADDSVTAKKVLVIAGPTAVGKSAIGVRVAQALDGEVVSVDSVQVYRELQIGANKITAEEMAGVPHHMIDVCSLADDQSPDPNRRFSVVRFCQLAEPIIDDIERRGKVPVLVGGSGFYLRSLLYGAPTHPQSDLAEVQRITQQLIAENDWDKSIKRLAATSPDYAATITRNNYNRLARALQIVARTGQPLRPISSFLADKKPRYSDVRGFVLHRPRHEMHRIVEDRCDDMIRRGLLDETRRLLDAGLITQDSTAGKSIGYRQAIQFLMSSPDITPERLQEFAELFKAATRAYVRRQTTWFRAERTFQWVDISSVEPLDEILRGWHSKI